MEGVLLESVPRVVEGKTVYRDLATSTWVGGYPASPTGRDAGSTLTPWHRPAGVAVDWFRYWHRRYLHEQMWLHYDAKATPTSEAVERHHRFPSGWHVWDGFAPERPEARKDGLDAKKPAQTERCIGNSARWAYNLTDSFLRVDAGAAILANRNTVKAALDNLRKESIKDQPKPPDASWPAVAGWFRYGVMEALEGGVTPGQIGKVDPHVPQAGRPNHRVAVPCLPRE